MNNSALKKNPCPCCGFLTLAGPDSDFQVCPVCLWENDPVQRIDPNYRIGANQISLKEARANYRAFKAAEVKFTHLVRNPAPEEYPSDQS